MNRQLNINQEFTDAKQQPSKSVAAFDAYLTSLKAQLPPFTESQRISALMTRLRPKLQEAIIRIGNLSVDRNALLSLATRLETTIKRSHAQTLQGQRSGGAPSTGGNKGGNRSNNSKPSQEERTAQSKKNKKENRKSGSDSKSKSKSKDKEWLKNIECFNCHKKSHYATDCRAPKAENPKNVPVRLVGSIRAHAVKSSNSGKGKSLSKTS